MQETLKIDEKFITDCLAHYSCRLQEIQSELIKSYECIISKNELIETLQVKVNLDSSGSGTTNAHKDLNHILEGVEKRQNEYIEEQFKIIEQLQLKEDAIRRTWICYEALPFVEKKILSKLYVENIKWEVMPLEMKVSKGTIVKKKKWAINQMVKLFESNYSNADIICKGNLSQVKKRKNVKWETEQLSLFDLDKGKRGEEREDTQWLKK